MNNRFKFRVWDTKQKKFLVGIPPMEYMLDKDEWDHRDCYDGDPRIFINNVFSKDFNGRLIFQQYTGLNDKNNIEVYEGDIVKINRCYTRPFVNEKQQIDYKFIDDGEIEIGQILWGWNIQKYLVSYEHIRYDDSEDFDKSPHRVEVIGNIFENPELLK